MHPKDAAGIENSVDPDQEQSDLGLHCLPRSICPKTWDHYGIFQIPWGNLQDIMALTL